MVLHLIISYHTIPYHIISSNITQYHTMQYHTIPYDIISYHIVDVLSCHMVDWFIILYQKILYNILNYKSKLDPILAQGAGVAIEDSYLLGKALEKNYRHISYDSFTITSFADKKEKEKISSTDMNYLFIKDNHSINMKNAFLDFEESRCVLSIISFTFLCLLFFCLPIFIFFF